MNLGLLSWRQGVFFQNVGICAITVAVVLYYVRGERSALPYAQLHPRANQHALVDERAVKGSRPQG